jgi:hypothetical protein
MYGTRFILSATTLVASATLAVPLALGPASAQTISASVDSKFVFDDPNPAAQSGAAVDISGDTAVVGAPFDDDSGNADTGAAYVFIRSGSTWALQAKLISGSTENSYFGASVAIDGDTVVVGAPHDDVIPLGNDGGAAWVFTRSGSTWSSGSKMTAPVLSGSNNNLDWFGTSVAISGDRIVVGAPGFDQDSPAKGNSGAAYVFKKSGSTWQFSSILLPSENAYFYRFGLSVAIAGDTALVGAPGDPTATGADGALDIGRAWVFAEDEVGAWSEQAKLVDPAGVDGDLLGWSVALDGDTALVGARGVDAQAGAAYVFSRSGTSWSSGTKLTASDRSSGDHFGEVVALDGGTALVGAPEDDNAAGSNAGSAYVFTGSSSSWAERTKLGPTGGSADDAAGQAVALAAGDAVVGVPGEDLPDAQNTGAALVMHGSATTWNQQGALTGSGLSAADQIGASVARSGDTVVVGVPGDDSSVGKDAGAAFVFVRSGSVWVQQAKLLPADLVGSRLFGTSVAISGDVVIVGSPDNAPAPTGTPGAAYVFRRSGSSWSQQAKLSPSDGQAYDCFGISVAFDGTTAAVGARGDDTPAGFNVGSAYTFEHSGEWPGTWAENKLVPDDGAAYDLFGQSVAVSGNTAIVGAFRDDTTGGEDAGSAYVFVRGDSTWSMQQKLTESAGVAGDQFGISVAVNGDTALVGSPHETSVYPADNGSAHLFTRSGTSWSAPTPLAADDGAPFDRFGSAVTLSDGLAVVGAEGDSDATGGSRGSAYVFSNGPSGWTLHTKVEAADGEPGDLFGTAVALDGDDLVVGAPVGSVPGNTNTGAVYELPDVTAPPNEPPTVIAKSPTSSAPITGSFSATFSEPVTGVGSATFSLKVADTGTTVAGAVSQPTTSSARFTPSTPLIPGQSYTASLTTGIEDLEGEPLAAAVSWTVRAVTTVDSNSVALQEVWDVDSSSAAYGGAYSTSPGPGSRKVFTFTGTNVTVYGARSASGGYATVYLDGTAMQTISCYAPSTTWKQVLFAKSGLSNAKHTVEIRPKGEKNSASKGTTVYVDAFKVGSTFYQERHAAVRDYFRRVTTTSAFGGSWDLVTHATSGDTGTRPWFAVQFKGTDAKVYATRNPHSGPAVVYIDGVAKATINLRSASTAYNVQVFDSAPLSDSVHTIMVAAAGTSSGAGSYVGIDRFVLGG